jgi:hypothetical protein
LSTSHYDRHWPTITVNSNFLTISSARARAGLVFLLVTAAAQAAGTLTFNADDAPGDGRGSWTLQKGSSPANPIFVAGIA